MLAEKVLSTISSNSMVDEGDRVLVAVSGGVDSVVLLDVLCRLAPQYKLDLVVAHLDHQLRGEASRNDARFVRQLASKRGVKLVSEAIDVSAVARKEKLGLEEAARMVRLKFLETAAGDVAADKIAIGHTANDLAETILFNLIRGAGMTGIAGIKPVSFPFIRPLIDVTRAEIVSYANRHAMEWRYDHSNADTRFTRNRIRHEIIPIMEDLNPRFIEALSRSAEIIRDENDALGDLLRPLLSQAIQDESEDRICLDRSYLKKLPRGIVRILIRNCLEKIRGDLQGISKANIDAICDLIGSSLCHGQIDLKDARARIQGDDLLLTKPQLETYPTEEMRLDLGKTALPPFGITLELEIRPWEGKLEDLNKAHANAELIDADKVSFPLHLRTRRSGDRFSPLGLPAMKKLKDFFIDCHIPFYERDKIPLLCDRKGIIMVVGYRISHTVRIDANTQRVMVIRWKEIE
jgi:tRNA(Ile)-lysidine synthase